MPRIDLPDGAWADVREDLAKAPRRLLKAVGDAELKMAAVPSFSHIRTAAEVDVSDQGAVRQAAQDMSKSLDVADVPALMRVMEDVKEAKVLALVTGWSFDEPLTLEGVGEIPGDAFAVLAAEAEKRGSSVGLASKAELLDPTPAADGSNA